MTTSATNTAPVVLVTGALAGIGRATALAFARQGARVVVSGRNQDAGAALAAELRALGAEALFLRADVRHEAEVRSLVDQTVERFGRLDAAVNNAGTEGKPGPITRRIQRVFNDAVHGNLPQYRQWLAYAAPALATASPNS